MEELKQFISTVPWGPSNIWSVKNPFSKPPFLEHKNTIKISSSSRSAHISICWPFSTLQPILKTQNKSPHILHNTTAVQEHDIFPFINPINTKLCFCPITSARKPLASTHRMKTIRCLVCTAREQHRGYGEGPVEGSLGPQSVQYLGGHPTLDTNLILFLMSVSNPWYKRSGFPNLTRAGHKKKTKQKTFLFPFISDWLLSLKYGLSFGKKSITFGQYNP